jgi:hypothetical protein
MAPVHSVAPLLRGRALPNRLMASRRVEGRGVRIASYIIATLSEAPLWAVTSACAPAPGIR